MAAGVVGVAGKAPDVDDLEPLGPSEPELLDAAEPELLGGETITSCAGDEVEPVKLSSPAYAAVMLCRPDVE